VASIQLIIFDGIDAQTIVYYCRFQKLCYGLKNNRKRRKSYYLKSWRVKDKNLEPTQLMSENETK